MACPFARLRRALPAADPDADVRFGVSARTQTTIRWVAFSAGPPRRGDRRATLGTQRPTWYRITRRRRPATPGW